MLKIKKISIFKRFFPDSVCIEAKMKMNKIRNFPKNISFLWFSVLHHTLAEIEPGVGRSIARILKSWNVIPKFQCSKSKIHPDTSSMKSPEFKNLDDLEILFEIRVFYPTSKNSMGSN